MGDMISKPDANPILLAVLDIIICGIPIGHFMMGQTKKAIILLVLCIVLNIVGLGFIVALLAAYDAYLLGQKLQSGQSIKIDENGFELFNSIPGLKPA